MIRRLIAVLLLSMTALGALPTHAEPQGPIGWLIIPSIKLYAPIYTAPIDDAGTLTRSDDYHTIDHPINHLEGTAWVDQGWGRVVLAGHNPGVFGRVPDLQGGERIIILSHTSAYEFTVVLVQVIENDRDVLAPTPGFQVSLLTCLHRGVTWLMVDAVPQ